jgi:hypothetical protein
MVGKGLGLLQRGPKMIFGEQQDARNVQLAARVEQQAQQMEQLKGMFEQAMAAQRGTRSLAAAAFNR